MAKLKHKPRKNTIAKRSLWLYPIVAIFSIVILWPSQLNAQNINVIRGTVQDSATRMTLPGVNVQVKGTNVGSSTGKNGEYTIPAKKGDVIVFSFIGYERQEAIVGDQNVINMLLGESSSTLKEVVAVGYGTQRKATLTGSVASVSGKDLQRSPALNVASNLSGQLPGVVTKMTSGEPGRDNPTILIRGRNTTGDNNPLVVVDGVQGVIGWERINPNDIESVSVLKDASAAIYGSRAANGVILITTKRGSSGKPVVSYSYNQAVTQPTRLPQMASSAEFAGYVNQLDAEAGQSPRYSAAEIELFRNGTDPNYINEDWYDAVLKNSSRQSQQNLNVRGGSEDVKYSVSGSYTNEGSIFKNGSLKYKTYSLRSNVDAQINKNLKLGFDLNGAYNDGNYPAYDVAATFAALKQIPFLPVYWPNGLPSPGIENGTNPAIMGTSLTGNQHTQTYNFNAKGSFDLTIPWVKGLGLDGYFVYSNNMVADKNWQTPWTVYDYNKLTGVYTPKTGGGILFPQLTQSFAQSPQTLLNLRLKYEFKIGDHSFNTFIAAEQSNLNSSNFFAFRKNYISTSIDELFAGNLVDQSTGGVRLESGRENLFGRVSYGFLDKYLLDFNYRYDGSSNFPKGKRFGFFPGASAAWRISQENFMKKLSFVDNLKLRVSVAKVGNDAIAAFQDLRLYTLGNTGMSFGAAPIATNGLVTGVTANPNITWEVGTTANIGLDASLWQGLFGFTADVFKQTRSNILATRDLAVPAYTGLVLPNENIGTVENTGFEFEMSHRKTVNDFSWRVAANVSYSHNNIVDISEAQNVAEWKKLEGHVLGATRYYHATGIFRTQDEINTSAIYPGTRVGDLKYEDKDGDGAITANDMYTMDKTNTPELVFGLNLSLKYKDFSLWANFAGASNVWQYYHVNARAAINQLEDVIINRYTPGSMNSKYPRLPTLETMVEPSGLQSDFWLKDATYGRLKTLEFSYNLSQNLLSKFKMQSVRLYLNGQNLFTVDNVKWADPENSSNSAAYYPQSKIYNLGINVTF
ncbi:MAG TPA: TonB-dependent receptor [Pedobacter sp.]|uniref:SusC/RagA family TonB-linked outer membrane protein n=1 Tax=Pedobacter sp. TaxID=1411316 RepID=UPI002B63094E|nr:TonB-dependent receptor [Pedobacter sp.]HMI05222.1 TonB-dependent receptor [Pedobacter sp.]